ncbi:MAG TPA: Rrf2 family transcriptional regulator, partial [Limnochordia bacterium]|nr:Rrf2 family transcriptional regulator [Limnochordia bacterium]
QGPISLKVIAERQALSEHYLEQLMGSLRKSGLVNSVRGAQGGYELARPAEEVRIGDVIRALEGPVLGVEPQQGREPACREALDGYWAQLTADINEVLDKTTLAQLKQEAERARAKRGSYMFHI